MYLHLLVPIDGSALSGPLVEHALALAASSGARVTFFNARPDFGASADGALLHASQPEAFVRGAAGQSRAILAKAEAAARAAGVPHGVQAEVSDRPYEAILEAAEKLGCDLIVIATHGRRGLKAAFTGSVTQKVLQGADRPVLVCAVESNLPASDAQRTLGILRDEHRSHAAVIHGLQQLVEYFGDSRTVPDFPLLRAMLHYIDRFSEQLHHPKEEFFIFEPLKVQCPEHAGLVAELEHQHRETSAQVAQLHAALQRYEAGEPGALADFARCVERFAQSQWHHMAAEEQVVLPAAERALDASVWRRATEALLENGDPRFGGNTDDAFADYFARLLNLIPYESRTPIHPMP